MSPVNHTGLVSELVGALSPVNHTGLFSELVGALSPVNHTGLHQGCQLRRKVDLKTKTAVKKREALAEGQLSLKRQLDGTRLLVRPTSFKLGTRLQSMR